ncbi:MAG TPA: MBL fold metallo-hydrolase [Syntrophobacter fumaroxidans]|nr:MBL fold metallo-hydrolase [Syntrophobacter fumaroxidans]
MPSQDFRIVLEHLPVGMFRTNCYVLAETRSHRAVVIDPGAEGERIAGRIGALGLQPVAILITHAHIDHIMGAWSLKEELGGKIFLHPKDQPLLDAHMIGMDDLACSHVPRFAADRTMEEGDVLDFGPIRLSVIETPGHTPGHVSVYFPEAKSVFVGDTIFAGSIGRTDFPGGSHDRLIRSVKEKIFTLPGDTLVYPGHGPGTTIEREIRTNPFFR